MAKVAPLASLRAGRRPDFFEVAGAAARMLRSGAQELSLSVRGGEVVDGAEDYWALYYLGCRLAAVSEGARERVDVPLEALGFFDEVVGHEARIYQDVLELVARDRPTPMVRLRGDWGRARVWAKLEWYNPLSLSIKDRTAWYMASMSAEALGGAGALYEASSSNTGVALAALARLLGLRARIYVPSTAEDFGPAMVRVLGGEAVVGGSSTTEILPRVLEDAARDGAVVLNQFSNPLNPAAHVRFTAKEIEYQARFAGLKLKGVFVSMGTGGHAAGIAFYFKNRMPGVRVVGVQPAGGGIPGIKRQDFSGWWGPMPRPDEVVEVSADEALDAAIDVARSNGLLFGVSGGAVVAAIRRLSGGLEEGDYVAVIPDHGIKYLDLYLSRLGERA